MAEEHGGSRQAQINKSQKYDLHPRLQKPQKSTFTPTPASHPSPVAHEK